MNKFWLIQRGAFRNLEFTTEFLGGTSKHLINPDYMGSSEFEWGAIPKAYRRIMGQYDKYSLHVTDLTTIGGAPFCLYCMNNQYEKTLDKIKTYLKEPYQLKEWTNMEAHFTTKYAFGVDHLKYQRKTNFWWCIDISRDDNDIGDWIAFIGASDRQNAFKRVIADDYLNWWMTKSELEREKDFKDSFS